MESLGGKEGTSLALGLLAEAASEEALLKADLRKACAEPL